MSKQLTDQQIHTTIGALRKSHVRLTGSVVRDALRRRYGSPGGVSRVYRLLQDVQSKNSGLDYQDVIAENAELKTKLAAASRRAELAEQRDDAHQVRWAAEVDSLRQQLREAMVDRRVMSQLQDQILELHRKIRKLTDPVVE